MKPPRFLWLLALAGAGLGGGCATNFRAPFHPPTGLVFSTIQAPLQTEFPQGGTPCFQTRGSATSWCIQDPFITGLSFAWEDCSISKAAANGKLKDVAYADYEAVQFFGVVGKMTVHAYGPVQGGLPP